MLNGGVAAMPQICAAYHRQGNNRGGAARCSMRAPLCDGMQDAGY